MMESSTLSELILTSLDIRRGRIAAISADGEIQVGNDNDDSLVFCDFLRTSSGTLPELNPGDRVLFLLDESIMRGYILGVIQAYRHSGVEHLLGNLDSAGADQSIKEIKLNAGERIELRCGESVLVMKKDGRIILRGTEITSRASEVNKIKGGAVKIN